MRSSHFKERKHQNPTPNNDINMLKRDRPSTILLTLLRLLLSGFWVTPHHVTALISVIENIHVAKPNDYISDLITTSSILKHSFLGPAGYHVFWFPNSFCLFSVFRKLTSSCQPLNVSKFWTCAYLSSLYSLREYNSTSSFNYL